MGQSSGMIDVTVSQAEGLAPAARPRRFAARDLVLSAAIVVVGSAAILAYSAARRRLGFSIIAGVVVLVSFMIWSRVYVRRRRGEETVCRVAAVPLSFVAGSGYAKLARSVPMASWFLSGRLVRGHQHELWLRYGDNVYRLHEIAQQLIVVVNPANRIISLRFVNSGSYVDVVARGVLDEHVSALLNLT